MALTLDKTGLPTRVYYLGIKNADEVGEILIKIADRCHNISSMVGNFSIEKIIEYIEETKIYILPLHEEIKKRFPEYSKVAYVMKEFLMTHIRNIEFFIDKLTETEAEDPLYDDVVSSRFVIRQGNCDKTCIDQTVTVFYKFRNNKLLIALEDVTYTPGTNNNDLITFLKLHNVLRESEDWSIKGISYSKPDSEKKMTFITLEK